MKPSSNIGYEFLFTWLHARNAQSVSGERLAAIVNHGSEDALRRRLQSMGIDATDRRRVQKLLTEQMLADLVHVMKMLDGPAAHFYACIVRRHFVENVKLLLRSFLFPDTRAEALRLLLVCDRFPSMDYDAAAQAGDGDKLVSYLPTTDSGRLSEILREAVETRDLFRAENLLDADSITLLINAAKRVSWSLRRVAVDLVRNLIDVQNLIRCLRNAEIYRLSREVFADLLIPGGTLSTDLLLDAMEQSSRTVFLNQLPREWQRFLIPLADFELFLVEAALWNRMLDSARKHFGDFQNPAASVAAFPFLREVEAINLARVYEGYHFGLNPQQMQPLVMGGRRSNV